MDLTPLLVITGMTKWSSLLLIDMWLLSVPTIDGIDLPIFLVLLLRGPLVMCIMESGSGLRGLDALIHYYQQIDHDFWLLHGNLLDSLEISDPVTEGIDDLHVLDVRDSVSGILEMFHVTPEAFITLLLDSLHSFGGRWPLIGVCFY
jgi:hypothetical protein